MCLQAKHNSGTSSTGVLAHNKVHILLSPIRHDASLSTHVVLSEFIDGDLCLHEVVVEDDDFPAEGSLFLLMVVGLRHERKYRQGTMEEEEKKSLSEVDRVDDKRGGAGSKGLKGRVEC